jgi:hypothetical protein
MDIASIFDWFASESMRAAGETNDLSQREKCTRLALMWAAAAQRNSIEEVIVLARHKSAVSTEPRPR